MRRAGLAGIGGVGLAAVQRQEDAAQRSAQIGEQVAADRRTHITEQVAMFRRRLEEFAVRYRSEINKDPQFRHHFVRMAKSIGVDPLSSAKDSSFLAGTLGIGLGTFYADLAVQVAHVCMATRSTNGGLISTSELTSRVNAMRGSHAGSVNEEDVRRALTKLTALQGGYTEVALAGKRYISSVPELLSSDTNAVMNAASAAPESCLTVDRLCASSGWTRERADRALTKLLREGLAWLDRLPVKDARGGQVFEDTYYFPSLSLGQSGP